MTLRQFIKDNRIDIDGYIKGVLKNPQVKLTNKDRELWVKSDARLQRWYQDSKRGYVYII
jgi:hypothetical protein